LRDGGLALNVNQNNKTICAAQATYDMGGGHAIKRRQADGRYSSIPMDVPGSFDGKSHIQETSTCSMMGPITKGDQFTIDALYDFGLHEGRKSPAGQYNEIMGIAVLYAAVDEG
jgi:hypothetical protein